MKLLHLFFIGGLCAAAACVGDSTVNPEDGGNDATVTDGATNDVNNVPDAASDGPTGCAARAASDTAGVFVAQTGSDVNSCGTRANACKTITYAIATAKAATGKTTIYVGAGVYQESVTLDAAITIEGGWNDTSGTWTPICDGTTSTAVTIEGVTNTTLAVAFSGSATVRDIKIASKAAADPSESIYGIIASGSATNLTLDQVVVDVVAGGAGAIGTDGTVGANATDAGCAVGSGLAGDAGTPGTGGAAGTFGATGFTTTSGGSAGTGLGGNAGTTGQSGACATCEAFVGTCPSTCNFGNKQVCAGNGTSGCGGAGGTGGTLGTGGGASIAVYVWDAHVTVFGGSFTPSNGGNGGNGGAGGNGGTAVPGVSGANATCATSLSSPQCLNTFCTGIFNSGYTLDGGSAGGNGGTGGMGGHGGGGSGGVSYAIVSGGDGGVTLNGNPTLAHGDGGAGGAAGGANGAAADRFP